MYELTIEKANEIRNAFGPNSKLYEKMSVEAVAEDFAEYQRDRNGQGDFSNWLDQHLKTEQLQVESRNAEDGVTKSKAAKQKKLLREMGARVRAIKPPKVKKEKPATPDRGPAGTASRKEKKTEQPAPVAATASPAKAQPVAPPKIGDEGLATEEDLTNPQHARLSDYRYYAVVDDKDRVIGRGFMAKIDGAPRRTWFALPNPNIEAAAWKKAGIREVTLETYQGLTLASLESGYPEFSSLKQPQQSAEAA